MLCCNATKARFFDVYRKKIAAIRIFKFSSLFFMFVVNIIGKHKIFLFVSVIDVFKLFIICPFSIFIFGSRTDIAHFLQFPFFSSNAKCNDDNKRKLYYNNKMNCFATDHVTTNFTKTNIINSTLFNNIAPLWSFLRWAYFSIKSHLSVLNCGWGQWSI